MAGKWLNDVNSDNDNSNELTTVQKILNMVVSYGSIAAAIHIGVHFKNIFYGIAAFAFFIVIQAVTIIVSMSREEYASFIAKKMTSSESTKELLKSLTYKYLPESCAALAAGYFGIRFLCNF